MNVLPVIKREMRAEARHGMTYWSRVIMAGLVITGIIWIAGGQTMHQELGSQMFTLLNSVLFMAIWLIVPMLTADSLAREKREGTLGLLFMTHLHAREIVLGKSLMHSLRGVNLLIAIVPMQIVPVVLGGVSWQELVMAAAINTSSISLALAAGILASSIARDWWHAFPLALALSMTFMFAATAVLFHGQLYFFFEVADGTLPIYRPMSSGEQHSLISTIWSRSFVLNKLSYQLQYGTGATDVFAGNWASFWKTRLNLAGGAYSEIWIRVTLAFLTTCLLVTWGIVGISAMIIGRSWRVRPDSARMLRLKRMLFSPMIWKSLLKDRLNLQLNTNPVSWLHEYSWNARVTKWGLCLLTMFICSHFLNQVHSGNQGLLAAIRIIMIAILFTAAFSGVSSFRSEKDSGGMELLLITPIGTDQIIQGQVAGVWKRYLPTVAVLTIVWYAVYFNIPGRFSHFRTEMHWSEPLLLLTTSYTLAVAGVRFSFSQHSLLTACCLALGVGLIAPIILLILVASLLPELPTIVHLIFVFGFQLYLITKSSAKADNLLNERTFFLGRSNQDERRKTPGGTVISDESFAGH